MKCLHRDANKRFHRLRLLGEGATSRVYEVEDEWREGSYALKEMRPERISRASLAQLGAEAGVLLGNAHTHLATGYELVFDMGTPALLMELVDGIDFLNYVRPDTLSRASVRVTQTADVFATSACTQEVELGGSLQVSRLRSALRQIVSGLQDLHARGHVHCDIKPENVLVTAEGRVVIVDFGSCVPTGLRLGPRRGTPGFMPPEQFVGNLSEATDWYAVGALLQCALTGRMPYGSSSITTRAAPYCSSAIDARIFSADLPADLVELALGLLDPRAHHRPSGGEVARVLEAASCVR